MSDDDRADFWRQLEADFMRWFGAFTAADREWARQRYFPAPSWQFGDLSCSVGGRWHAAERPRTDVVPMGLMEFAGILAAIERRGPGCSYRMRFVWFPGGAAEWPAVELWE